MYLIFQNIKRVWKGIQIDFQKWLVFLARLKMILLLLQATKYQHHITSYAYIADLYAGLELET